MLNLKDVTIDYGSIRALNKINIKIDEGEIVCLLGGNASGKTTTMKAILGLLKLTVGSIEYNGQRISGLRTSQIVEMGISPVPEGKRIFGQMTILENLLMGAFVRKNGKAIKEDLERVFNLFPILKERQNQLGGTLSGGEQQMLSIGRALMAKPKLLLMDEPSMGLAPLIIEEIFDIIQQINKEGTTIFIIEQNANVALSIANRGYVLQNGEIIMQGTSNELLADEIFRRAYLGR